MSPKYLWHCNVTSNISCVFIKCTVKIIIVIQKRIPIIEIWKYAINAALPLILRCSFWHLNVNAIQIKALGPKLIFISYDHFQLNVHTSVYFKSGIEILPKRLKKVLIAVLLSAYLKCRYLDWIEILSSNKVRGYGKREQYSKDGPNAVGLSIYVPSADSCKVT